ncbi:Spc97 / Spc98 family of spindle pole body component [Prunus dulcis]|uniref:Gamma-tubulin complex component n=1 Tax=Prunus dulcis TaxID=3755 RepID=A0A4Y1RM60_PRUDU|nr:Spc97 / Spc98 family of spindle pole body component [Prunus dulcis]
MVRLGGVTESLERFLLLLSSSLTHRKKTNEIMAMDTNFASSLFENLNLEDPWLPPTTWESIPSESGNFHLRNPKSSSSHSLYHASTVSEASLVRLAMNAVQGVETALVSIQKLSAAFCSDPADRTFHQIPSLWNRSSSTHALGNILEPIGCSGLLVFLLRKFVDYFSNLNVESEDHVDGEAQVKQCPPYSLVNHAFAVSVGKVVEGYMCALDTLYASVGLRRSSCSSSVVADPAHRPLLKFLFLRTCEPYCGFIRSWIFKAEISDPYKEFVVEYADSLSPNQHGKADISIDFPLATIREQDGVSVPCFLKDVLIPLVRAGQQLQVLVKLLELCTFVATNDHTYEGFLPCWTGFSGNCPYYSSPLTFIKGNVEAMLLSRDRYYRRMQEKLENLSAKLEFRYQQVVRPGTLPVLLDNGGRSSTNPGLFVLDDNFIPSPTNDKRESNGVHDLDSGELSARDGLSDLTDSYESSECSFDSTSAEQNVSEQMVELPNHIVGMEQKYLSALSFSMSMPVDNLQKPHVREESCHIVSDQSRLCERRDALAHSHHKGVFTSQISVPIKPKESNLSAMSDVQFADCLSDKDWPEGGLFESYSAIDEEYKDGRRSHPMDSPSKVNERIPEALKEGTSYFRKRVGTNSALIEEAYGKDQPQNVTYTSSDLFTLQQWKVCLEKLPAGLMDSNASVTSVKSDRFGKQDFGGDSVSIDKTKVSDSLPFSDSKDHDQENANLTNVSGGSCWESLLGRFSDTVINRVEDHGQSLSEIFEIPLDFIIDKCLLQEIMLQYPYFCALSRRKIHLVLFMYVSKLTIKLLEEGFDLQEHLLALRRYHFMELADWADLFIMSLWHHKWCVTEADHRLSEIQGFLESSVQRSSCERDPHKDRVDWPISIILSPSALKMYAEIFSFLIQVKLAIFSLTDVWRQLKDLVHSISQNNDSEQNEREVSHFNALVKMRHQVKDMMDLQSVHLAYLIDSLDICFLSDETRPIARIIESILQCALDFRSCLTREMWDVGTSQGNLIARLSGINISQVVVIKQMFDKNMKELHLCYLKSPKHGKFGLSHFWEYLNYNKYYSDVGNEMAYYAFSV